jgi:hypothetical protein
MVESAKRRLPPFLGASLIGAYSGIILQCLLAWSKEYNHLDWSEAWAIPIVIAIYGFIALPFVSLALLVFGVPAAWLLSSYRKELWVGVLSVVSGALFGKVVFFAIDHFLFVGFYNPWSVTITDMGVLYGLPTGLAWWWLRRES